MSLCPRLSEEKIRTLGRQEYPSALAKKEGSDKLYKRLLAKFVPQKRGQSYPEPKFKDSETLKSVPPPSIYFEPNSTILKSPATSHSVFGISTSSLAVEPPSVSQASISIEHSVDSAVPQLPFSTSHPSLVPLLSAGVASTAPDAQPAHYPPPELSPTPDPNYPVKAVHPSYPMQPFPCPTMDHLLDYQSQLVELNDTMLEVPQALSTMECMLPVVQGAAQDATHALKHVVLQRYYLEHNVLSQMKSMQSLWDGTNVMPAGAKRDRWSAFLDDVDREYDRLEQIEAVGIYRS
ncbi:hypothetical protein GGX14DRAFT_631878 [Mycena pura]|uniref:Uncharacterized protein n=1 Tax=Mycena pura TaxID=153505 RepID=A0AAD6VDL6_9AGAR|nr:hypothetical protein GGX14DRAFT_631878 [Mycena pura]